MHFVVVICCSFSGIISGFITLVYNMKKSFVAGRIMFCFSAYQILAANSRDIRGNSTHVSMST